MVTLRRRGIFYLIEGEEARKLAPLLGIKLTEKKIISPGGEEETKITCGFPHSGLDKYIRKPTATSTNSPGAIPGTPSGCWIMTGTGSTT